MIASNSFKEGWEFTTKNQEGMVAAQIGEDYVNNVDNAINQLTKDINAKMGSQENILALKGFIAEYWHAGTFNINAALEDSSHRAHIERSNEMGSVDISGNFGFDY